MMTACCRRRCLLLGLPIALIAQLLLFGDVAVDRIRTSVNLAEAYARGYHVYGPGGAAPSAPALLLATRRLNRFDPSVLPPRCAGLAQLVPLSNLTAQEVALRKACAEALYLVHYASGGSRRGAILWFQHFPKSFGSSFVKMAAANGAQFFVPQFNGNPAGTLSYERFETLPASKQRFVLQRTNTYRRTAQRGDRELFDLWQRGLVAGRKLFAALGPRAQAELFKLSRLESGLDFVASEQQFPARSDVLAPFPLVYATILREPGSRVLSEMAFKRRAGSAAAHKAAAAAPATFVLSHRNMGVCQLSGRCWDHAAALRNSVAGTYDSACPGCPFARLGAADLEAARSVLRSFSLVLIAERISEAAPLLKRVLGWNQTRVLVRNTVNREKGLIVAAIEQEFAASRVAGGQDSRDLLTFIRSKNKLDAELYRFAEELFERAVSNASRGLLA